MSLSKEQLRKIHGITESTEPADQTVLARVAYHEAVAKWLASHYSSLQAIFAVIGFVFVLLPVLSKTWRSILDNIPIIRTVFYDYSTLSGLAAINFYILVVLFLLKNWKAKDLPGGEVIGVDYKNIVAMELYPRTRKEEWAYWLDTLFSFAAVTIWIFLPFGLMAYFINSGK